MRMDFWLILAVLALFAVNQCSKASVHTGDAFPTLNVAPMRGSTAWNKEMLTGHMTLVQVFASWCPHCANEVGGMAQIKEQFPLVPIIGIVWRDEAKNITPFLQRYGDPYQSLWIDTQDDLNAKLRIAGIPALYLLDEHGIIRDQFIGELTPEGRAVLIQKIAASSPKSIPIR